MAEKPKDRAVAYVRKHREKLEKVVQRCVNRVLSEQPHDPYTALLGLLSKHSKEGLCFSEFRTWPVGAANVGCEVVVSVRGSKVGVHRTELPVVLVHRGLEAAAASLRLHQSDLEEGQEIEEDDETNDPAVAPVGGDAADEADMPPCAEVASRLAAVLAPALAGSDRASTPASAIAGAVSAKEGPNVLDVPQLRRGLRTVLGKACHPRIRALRDAVGALLLGATSTLFNGSVVDAIRQRLTLLRRPCAPRLRCRTDLAEWQHRWPHLLTPLKQRGRCCLYLGLTVWAATLPDLEGYAPEFVDCAAVVARRAAAVETEEGASGQQKEHDADEFCPPLNALSVVAALAAEITAKMGDAPAGDADKDEVQLALEQARSALQAVVPSYLELEDEAPASTMEGDWTLATSQQLGAVYFALFFDQSGGAEVRSDMADYVKGLVEEEPLIRLVVMKGAEDDLDMHPHENVVFSRQSPRLPGQCLGLELGPPGDAYVRKIDLLWHAELMGAQPEVFDECHGIYDFSLCPERLSPTWLDVALASPEQSRRFVLPGAGAEAMKDMLRPMELGMRRHLTSVYRRRRVTEGDEGVESITATKFREGLAKLGYASASKHWVTLFRFADLPGNGSITATELEALEKSRGELPGLEELDGFRLWLTSWAMRRQTTPRMSPLAMLWRRMDSSCIGEVSFAQFLTALQRMCYPGAANGAAAISLQALFAALDKRGAGALCESDIAALGAIAATFQLQRVRRVREFLDSQFGSMRRAFRGLDASRRGAMTPTEFEESMQVTQGYGDVEDVRACCHFLDRDGSMSFVSKDIESLASFSEAAVLQEAAEFRDHMVAKCGSIQEAFEAFENLRREQLEALSEHSRNPDSKPSSKVGSRRQSKEGADITLERQRADAAAEAQVQGLGPDAFTEGVRWSGFRGSGEPRILFNFLDAMHVGFVSPIEFAALDALGAAAALEQSSQKLQGAVTSLQKFALEKALEAAGPGAVARAASGSEERLQQPWAADLHARLMATTDVNL